MKDQIELDKKAKQDIELFYRTTLEEKEKLIVVLRAERNESSLPLSPIKSDDKEEELFFRNNDKNESEMLIELKEKNKRLELLLNKSREFINKQNVQINALNTEKENLLKKSTTDENLLKIENEHNTFEQDLKISELKINELNKIVEESRDSQSKLNSLLIEKDVFYKEQIKMLEVDFNNKQANYESEINQLKKNIEKLNEEIESTTLSNNSKNKMFEEQIEKLKTENNKMVQDVKETNTNVDDLKQVNEQITNQKRELEILNASLKINDEEIRTKLSETLKEIDEKNNELKIFREGLNEEILKKEEIIKNLNQSVSVLQNDIKLKEELIIEANNQIESMKLKIKTDNDLKNFIQKKFNSESEDIEELIDNYKNKSETNITEMEKKIHNLNDDLKNERENYKRLFDDFERFKENDYKKLESNNEMIKQDFENLSRSNEKLVNDHEVS